MDIARRLRSWVSAAAVALVVSVVCPVLASEEGEVAADQVSVASYRSFLGDPFGFGYQGILYTHTGDSRGLYGPEHDLARDNITDTFEGYGLSVVLEPFTYSGTTYFNVVATKLGTVYPDQEYIVGAHFDSVGNPGADDNASGVALVLEAARIISQYDSEYTIRFIAFDREEQGLVGSYAYVDAHFDDDILGMISTDMVAYDPNTNHALVFGSTASLPIKNALGQAIITYSEYGGTALTYTDGGWSGGSDHAPFNAAGFQACLLIEGAVWSNPHYHTQQDTVDTIGYINCVYAVRMTRSIVGFLVDHANVLVSLADGDHDQDGDVDLFDFAWCQLCFSGDQVAYPAELGCEVFDFDRDDDVDAADYTEFHVLFSGPA